MVKTISSIVLGCFLLIAFLGCNSKKKPSEKDITIVTTTTMITDMVKNIVGDSIKVVGLMGAGVDPHTYKASEGDVNRLTKANFIFYNGLHLEGKMNEIFENLGRVGTKKTYALSDALEKNELRSSKDFVGNYDPHIWFSIPKWKKCASYVALRLEEEIPEKKAIFESNLAKYLSQIDSLSQVVQTKIDSLPKEKRKLVTAHDAFGYFGQDYDFQVVGLQGLSTATEAGTQNVIEVANYITENKIPAIFVESSISDRTMKALQQAVEAKGHSVKIGGTLYSDALGSPGTKDGTYVGMYMHNVNTLVNALQ